MKKYKLVVGCLVILLLLIVQPMRATWFAAGTATPCDINSIPFPVDANRLPNFKGWGERPLGTSSFPLNWDSNEPNALVSWRLVSSSGGASVSTSASPNWHLNILATSSCTLYIGVELSKQGSTIWVPATFAIRCVDLINDNTIPKPHSTCGG